MAIAADKRPHPPASFVASSAGDDFSLPPWLAVGVAGCPANPEAKRSGPDDPIDGLADIAFEAGQIEAVAQAARERGLFRTEYLDALFDNPHDHITPLRGSELWQAALLELWLQENRI